MGINIRQVGIPPDEDKFIVFMAKVHFWHVPISLMLIGLMGSLLVYYISPSKWSQYTGIGFYVLFIVFLIAFIRDIRQLNKITHVRHIIEKMKSRKK